MFNERERPVLPAQFAMRVAILSGIALVMFSIIFFRLWYLQVLSSDHYLKQAQNNQVRDVTVQAPRGEILDRNGKVLVDNRTALALQILPTELPQKRHKQREEFARLSHVINMSTDRIEKQIRQQTKDLPSNPVTLRRDVSYDLVYYLRENQDKYPGVTVQRVYVRNYPDGSLAAQIYGYVREVTKQQLNEARYQGLQPGDQVGQSGIENTYDNVLRGTNGMTRVQVDAAGNPTGHILNQVQPKPGDNLVLSLDRPVQQAGEQAINSFSTPGAFVAMNVKNGQILGLGSSPSFDPAVFSKPVIPTSVYKQLTSQTTYAPLTNRAIQGLYPDGLDLQADHRHRGAGERDDHAQHDDRRRRFIQSRRWQHSPERRRGVLRCAPAHPGTPGLLGRLLLQRRLPTSTRPATRAHRTSGRTTSASATPTGIDLPGEVAGLLPTPQWRDQLYKEAQSPNSPGGTSVVPGDPTDRPWTLGDNVNLAVGQGDLQADPLQMAVAYAAIGNGGDVVTPARRQGRRGPERQRRAGDRPGPDPSPGHQPELPLGDHAGDPRGGAVTGRDVLSGVRQLPDPDGGQDRYGPAAPATRTSPGTCAWPRIRTRRSSSRRRSSREGSVFKPRRRSRGRSSPPTTTSTRPRPRRPAANRRSRRPSRPPPRSSVTPTDGLRCVSQAVRGRRAPGKPPRERGGLLAMDPLLLLAALGLIGFSLFTLGAATGHDIPNSPYFYVLRQAIYAVIGVALMLGLARVDYSRFRELRVGLYTAMMTTIIAVLLLGQATRGSRRWIELPFFTFQPSELGKVLLILALAGFAIDRGRRVGERQRTARILLLGFVPALIVIMQPDLGTGIVYIVITLATLFFVGVRWTHFALLGGLLAAAVSVVLVIAPAIGHPVLHGYQQERLTSFLNPSSDPATRRIRSISR